MNNLVAYIYNHTAPYWFVPARGRVLEACKTGGMVEVRAAVKAALNDGTPSSTWAAAMLRALAEMEKAA